MRVSIYIRVSTEDQVKEGYSLEVQREYLESFAEREGYEIYKVYSDDGISGYSLERPALKKLLEDARQKRFDLVLVYKIDRFSRNLRDLLNLMDKLYSYEVGFKSATEPFDSTTSAGKLMLQQLGSFAEFERNRLAERVFPGMVKGIKAGNWQGARFAPCGYAYNKEKKLLEVNEKEAELVKTIYKMYISGRSIRSITEYLTKKGHRTRNDNILGTKFISDILKNRIYTGKLVWNKSRYDKTKKTKRGFRYIKNPQEKIIVAQGRHQPLISDEDFAIVQEKLKEKKIVWKRRASEYPLSGVLYCTKCNHKYLGISSISNHRTGFKQRYYRCGGPQTSFIQCKNKCVKADIIESQVAELLETLLKNNKLKSSRWTTVTELESPAIEQISKNELEKLQEKLKIVLQKQSKLTDAYLDNLLSEEVYREKSETLKTEEDDLKKRIALQEVRAIERENSKNYKNRVAEFIEGYNPRAKTIDNLTKKQVLQLLFKNIKIANKSLFSFDFFAPFNFLFLEQQERSQCLQTKRLSSKNRPHFTSELSDGRWPIYSKSMISMAEALIE
ncbi:MAG: recombinase family protein [Pseudomonadota bacterium]